MAELKTMPRAVFASIILACAMALLNVVRIVWQYYSQDRPLSRGFFYAGLIAFLIITQSFSLIRKSKLGYMAVLMLCMPPVLGVFFLSIHALRLAVEGNLANDQIGMVPSVIVLVQFVTIVFLVISLLRRDVREWVWKEPRPVAVPA
jgi:glucan phosphoethanolaminetransferase (alkaline phosphatase superfamily)